MAASKWDAYESLGITKRYAGQVNCTGTNNRKEPCRLPVSPTCYLQVCSILDELEKRAHTNQLSQMLDLDHLARLSLCHHHQADAPKKVKEWKIPILEEEKRKLQEMAGQQWSGTSQVVPAIEPWIKPGFQPNPFQDEEINEMRSAITTIGGLMRNEEYKALLERFLMSLPDTGMQVMGMPAVTFRDPIVAFFLWLEKVTS
ncbi:hypothetical protein BDZ45DRAFT_750883 [Acephala macrosclerotiorum]|nr:hypothetical protein BDZ45DRAFT_750883 [Acephala macrosclerotiorum]